MTTGRINQVTVYRRRGAFTCCKHPLLTSPIKVGSFPGWAFVTRPRCPHTLSALQSVAVMFGVPQKSVQAPHNQQQEHLIPRSHRFQAQISLSRGQGSRPLVRTTMDRRHLQGTQQSRWIPKWLFDKRV
jgi:hypothetical protein